MNETQNSERWDRSAPFYDGAYGKMEFYPKMIERIVALANPRQDDIVLDVGTGTGELALKIAPRVKVAKAEEFASMFGIICACKN